MEWLRTEWRRLDSASGTPPFDQLRVALIDAIRTGRLASGARLPTVRDLAAELGFAANTVARAYRELETAGIIETHGRRGSFVARRDPTDSAMAEAARVYAEATRALGVGIDEARRYLDAEFGEPQAGPNSSSA